MSRLAILILLVFYRVLRSLKEQVGGAAEGMGEFKPPAESDIHRAQDRHFDVPIAGTFLVNQ